MSNNKEHLDIEDNESGLTKGIRLEGQVRPDRQFAYGEFGNVFNLGPIPMEYQRGLTYGKEYANSAVYSAIMAYSWALSAAGIQHIRTDENGEIEILGNSMASRVLRYPNAYQQEGDLILSMVSSLLYSGNSYVYASKDNGRIRSLHPVSPNAVQVALSDDMAEVWYSLNNWDKLEFIDDAALYDNVVPSRYMAHTKLYTSYNTLIGVSPLTACALSSDLGNTIQAQTLAFHTNMRRPSGLLKTPMVLNRDQMGELRNRWDEQSAIWNSGGVPIASSGLEWQPLGINALDSEVISTYTMTVEDIARVFRIPTALMGLQGISGDTEGLLSAWKMQGLLFVAEQIERALERLFDLPIDEEFRFDLEVLSRASLAVQVETMSKGVMGGVFSPDEARKRLGYGPVPYGDEPRLQAQQVPLSMVGNIQAMTNTAPSAPTTPDNNQENNNPVAVVDGNEVKIQNTTKSLDEMVSLLQYKIKRKGETTNG